MELALDMVEEWCMQSDDGKLLREVAEEWVEENQETVDKWLEK